MTPRFHLTPVRMLSLTAHPTKDVKQGNAPALLIRVQTWTTILDTTVAVSQIIGNIINSRPRCTYPS